MGSATVGARRALPVLSAHGPSVICRRAWRCGRYPTSKRQGRFLLPAATSSAPKRARRRRALCLESQSSGPIRRTFDVTVEVGIQFRTRSGNTAGGSRRLFGVFSILVFISGLTFLMKQGFPAPSCSSIYATAFQQSPSDHESDIAYDRIPQTRDNGAVVSGKMRNTYRDLRFFRFAALPKSHLA